MGNNHEDFSWLKSQSYLIDDGSEDKEVKYIKMCVIKRPLNLNIMKTV